MFVQSLKSINAVRRKEAGCTIAWSYTEQTSWVQFFKYLGDLAKELDQRAELNGKTYSQIILSNFRWAKLAALKMPHGSSQT